MKIITALTAKLIADLMVTVIETPVLQWLDTIELFQSSPQIVKGAGISYSQEIIYNKHVIFDVTYDDPDDEEGTYSGNKRIGWQDFENGFMLLANKCPKVFARIVDESYDAADADTWFQYVVLGEDVYG